MSEEQKPVVEETKEESKEETPKEETKSEMAEQKEEPVKAEQEAQGEEEEGKSLAAPKFQFKFGSKGGAGANEGMKKAAAGSDTKEAKQGSSNDDDDENDGDFQMDLGDVTAEQLQQSLAGEIEGRFDNLMGGSSGYLESLPKPVLRRVNALENIQDDVDKRMAAYELAKRELQKQLYADLEPYYAKRSTIITGEYEPTDEECKIEDEFTQEEEANAAKAEAEESQGDAGASSNTTTSSSGNTIKGIPGFWSTALRNHEMFDDVINEDDAKALEFLEDIKCSSNFDNEKAEGFTLEFVFGENPFFSNKVITKTYFMAFNEQFAMPMLDHTESTTIEWFPGKDLTSKTIRQKRGNARGGKTRTQTRKVKKESFFNFFEYPDVDPRMSEEQLEMINDLVERDYLLGSTMKDRIIPNAIAWFTGEALIPDEFGGEDQEFTEEELAALGIDLSDPKILAQLMGGSMEGMEGALGGMGGMMGGYPDMGDDDDDDEGEEECETQ